MKPKGSLSRKKSHSAAVSAVPLQPKMTARFSGFDKDAPDTAALQLRAMMLGQSGIGDGPRLYPVKDAAFAEIDSRHRDAEFPEHVAIGPLQPLPFVLGSLRRSHRADLQPVAAPARRR